MRPVYEARHEVENPVTVLSSVHGKKKMIMSLEWTEVERLGQSGASEVGIESMACNQYPNQSRIPIGESFQVQFVVDTYAISAVIGVRFVSMKSYVVATIMMILIMLLLLRMMMVMFVVVAREGKETTPDRKDSCNPTDASFSVNLEYLSHTL